MKRQSWVRTLVGAVVLSLLVGGSVSADRGVSATLGDVQISLQQAAFLSCHDLDYPVLRCFDTSSEMANEVQRRIRGNGLSDTQFAVLDVGYVIVYEHAGYSGSALSLSADQGWLSSIGWNDRISSFKSFGAAGNFRENSPASGFYYYFSSSSQVPTLNGTYNDKFSALYLN
ncbi:MAG: hypothetical protein ABI598_02330 [Chloroflexota bacterium]